MFDIFFECYGVPRVMIGVDFLFGAYNNNPKNYGSTT